MTTHHKIVSLVRLKNIAAKLRRQKKQIALTNGCFDILHYGHISYLEKAKKKNRVLILALNSDQSIRMIKGPLRPIVSQKERAHVLAALSCIDYVVIFNEPTPIKVITAIKPDVLIKGADWKGKTVVGEKVVKSNGGRVEFVTYIPKFSTTNIIETILKKCAG